MLHFRGRPLLGLILTHLPSPQTEAAPPPSRPPQSLTPGVWNNPLHIYPLCPKYNIQVPTKFSWFCSAKSSTLKCLASSFQNCFTSSAHHRLAISSHFTINASWICPQHRSSLPRELYPEAISSAAEPLITLPSHLTPLSTPTNQSIQPCPQQWSSCQDNPSALFSSQQPPQIQSFPKCPVLVLMM